MGVDVLKDVGANGRIRHVAKDELVEGVVVALGVRFKLEPNQLAAVLTANDLAHVRLEPGRGNREGETCLNEHKFKKK